MRFRWESTCIGSATLTLKLRQLPVLSVVPVQVFGFGGVQGSGFVGSRIAESAIRRHTTITVGLHQGRGWPQNKGTDAESARKRPLWF